VDKIYFEDEESFIKYILNIEKIFNEQVEFDYITEFLDSIDLNSIILK